MNVVIKNAGLKGSVKAIASKSQAHRLLICAAFADRPTEIVCSETSKDIDATAECLRALGCSIERDQERGLFKVMPAGKINDTAVMDCGESGSTLRHFIFKLLRPLRQAHLCGTDGYRGRGHHYNVISGSLYVRKSPYYLFHFLVVEPSRGMGQRGRAKFNYYASALYHLFIPLLKI